MVRASGLFANERQEQPARRWCDVHALFPLSANRPTVLTMTASKHEEVAALEALRDSSAELAQYLDEINGKMLQMNHQNELSLRVLDNWSSVLAISKINGSSAAAAASSAAGKPHVDKALVRTSP
uniref:Outer kinetochore protein DAD2 n=1 Tax=Peronospora matthiolae TaxID=2874970 RepID=A0AAV1TQU1_9STRA